MNKAKLWRVWPSPIFLAWAVVLCGAVGAERTGPDVRRDAVVAAVERVLPSVVNIGTETIVRVRDPFEEFFREFWGPYHRRLPPQSRYSLGSGVIIDEAGYVLTNGHVVRRADKIWVQLSTRPDVYEAELVALDERTDLALLRLKARPGEKFTAIKFAADDDLLLGETVLALGNPFGLGGSVSRGILSSKARQVPIEDAPLETQSWLQIDAPINPGNSGGPLVNLNGELIGLNTAILREAQGIGFAIPVKRINEALAEMLAPENARTRLWFGARIYAGAGPRKVIYVEPESPAAKAGLEVGDVILEVDGKVPRSYIELAEMLAAADKAPLRLKVQRQPGEVRSLTVRLVPEREFFNAALIQKKLGVSLQELTPELADALGLSDTEGFIVSGVERGTPAARLLEPGMRVISIDGRQPADLIEAAKIIYRKQRGETVRLGVVVQERRGNFIFSRTGTVELPVR
ncbi:MAG: trypsin-like peptidase domain-containing protein [Verrucomicrobiae bacterium]|nr:trypsin-like peptidase domain-containing protein [Verrucomicrobiae bacterium]MDW7980366.1 trypsin-like peptidase domain-containing protein [Verrucomicrobiales bacterium]